MGKTVTISDDLAALLEARQKEVGYASLDETAEAFIAYGLVANDANDDQSDGFTDDALKALIDEGENSGNTVAWDSAKVRAEVLRRYAKR
jgi:hypothetical protein